MASTYRFADLVERAVADAPPLTPEQLDALAVLFTVPANDANQERLPMAA